MFRAFATTYFNPNVITWRKILTGDKKRRNKIRRNKRNALKIIDIVTKKIFTKFSQIDVRHLKFFIKSADEQVPEGPFFTHSNVLHFQPISVSISRLISTYWSLQRPAELCRVVSVTRKKTAIYQFPLHFKLSRVVYRDNSPGGQTDGPGHA